MFHFANLHSYLEEIFERKVNFGEPENLKEVIKDDVLGEVWAVLLCIRDILEQYQDILEFTQNSAGDFPEAGRGRSVEGVRFLIVNKEPY